MAPDRRSFLVQSAALLGGLALPAAADAAAPATHTVCGFDKKRKTKLCTVSVKGPLQYFPARGGGNDVNGCWIACLQMVLKFYGHVVPAANILRDCYGGKVPRNPWQDLSALKGQVTDEKGRKLSLTTEKLSVRATDAAELLADNQPLIIGAFQPAHPVLLTSMSYTGDMFGGMTIVDATVLDPTQGKGTRIVSSPDWVNVTFITRVALHKKG